MIKKLYGKNLNFLIGSGASVGGDDGITTLSTSWKEDGKDLSIEDILDKHKDDNGLQDIIYTYYYHKIIKKGFLADIDNKNNSVLKNYKRFLSDIIKFLQRENYQKERRVNIFTTNYDLFFEKAADELTGKYDFFFNDGSSGNITRKLSMRNFHKKVVHTGAFDNFDREIPIINLFKVHGSVSWNYLESGEIGINYIESDDLKIPENGLEKISQKEVKEITLSNNPGNIKKIISNHYALVLPTKGKFESTLYEEFYYQYLRQLSYELEKDNSVLIVFGFSFADEHITEIVKRALNNPFLKVYVYCFKKEDKENISKKLSGVAEEKIEYIVPQDKGLIDFEIFIKKLFAKNIENSGSESNE